MTFKKGGRVFVQVLGRGFWQWTTGILFEDKYRGCWEVKVHPSDTTIYVLKYESDLVPISENATRAQVKAMLSLLGNK